MNACQPAVMANHSRQPWPPRAWPGPISMALCRSSALRRSIGFIAIAGAQRVLAELVLATAGVGVVDAATLEQIPGEVLARNRRVYRVYVA